MSCNPGLNRSLGRNRRHGPVAIDEVTLMAMPVEQENYGKISGEIIVPPPAIGIVMIAVPLPVVAELEPYSRLPPTAQLQSVATF
jgi:hypothetical protein